MLGGDGPENRVYRTSPPRGSAASEQRTAIVTSPDSSRNNPRTSVASPYVVSMMDAPKANTTSVQPLPATSPREFLTLKMASDTRRDGYEADPGTRKGGYEADPGTRKGKTAGDPVTDTRASTDQATYTKRTSRRGSPIVVQSSGSTDSSNDDNREVHETQGRGGADTQPPYAAEPPADPEEGGKSGGGNKGKGGPPTKDGEAGREGSAGDEEHGEDDGADLLNTAMVRDMVHRLDVKEGTWMSGSKNPIIVDLSRDAAHREDMLELRPERQNKNIVDLTKDTQKVRRDGEEATAASGGADVAKDSWIGKPDWTIGHDPLAIKLSPRLREVIDSLVVKKYEESKNTNAGSTGQDKTLGGEGSEDTTLTDVSALGYPESDPLRNYFNMQILLREAEIAEAEALSEPTSLTFSTLNPDDEAGIAHDEHGNIIPKPPVDSNEQMINDKRRPYQE